MNRNDIIRMAGDSGLTTLMDEFSYRALLEGREPVWERFREFAALVAAVEREACAKVAETHVLHELADSDDWPDAIAAAIRARGQQ